jgi:prolyl oligopeptidase
MPSQVPAPATRADDVVEVLHGVTVHDPYRWLEDGESPAVRGWATAQGAHTRRVLDALPGRAAIAARLAETLDRGALGGTHPRGSRRFFLRRGAGMDQLALFVQDDTPAAPHAATAVRDVRDVQTARVLVDPGTLSADGATALDWWQPTKDGELICFGLSEAGSEDSTLHLLRVEDGVWLPDRITRCRLAAIAFEPGNEAFLYTRYPERGTVPAGEESYHRHVYRHVVGTDPAEDVRLFGEGRDATDFPSLLSISDDGAWTVLTVSQGWERSAVFLRRGQGPFEPIFEGPANRLSAWFAGDRLLGLTNCDAALGRLVEIDPERPAPADWRDVVPESGHLLLGAAVTSRSLLVHHLVHATSRVTECTHWGDTIRTLPIPPLSTVSAIGAQPTAEEAYLTVEAFTRPAATMTVEGEVVRALEPPPGFDADRYPVRQVWFGSRDGTLVPMFLIGRTEGDGPTVLTGYGGFTVSLTPTWMPTTVPFLEAGGLLAIANLRGGSEFGEAWHRAGSREHKQNVFDDFVAAAEWLCAHGLTRPERLGILGGSNGGLLVGAALTQRPDLFGAVVCRVPLLDMVRYEQFKMARLWADEYGSAADPEQFGWLYRYSPYHHVRDGERYPPVLLTTGEEDTRVDPLHARKMAARLQSAAREATILLRVEPRAGHGQGKPVAKIVPEETDVWAFLLWALGHSSPPG